MSAMDRLARPTDHPFQASLAHYGVVLPSAEANALFNDLLEHTPWARRTMRLHGKEVAIPRELAWYGAAKDQGPYAAGASAWPENLLRIKAFVEERTGYLYNACLCNLYRDGEDSVAWHSDREAFNGAVASLSLGATRVFRVRAKADHRLMVDFPLPNGSLLLMRPGCQERTEHCIPKTRKPVGPRINLTFRQVHEER